MPQFLMSLLGGLIIGLAVTLMLLFNGRVTGISGIVYGIGNNSSSEKKWRLLFILGLVAGGFLIQLLAPQAFTNNLNHPPLRIVIAGVLVGFGTVLGNGCTSGHGVCGISRFSLRSITATMTFIAFGALVVWLVGR